jgi:hypothetical protein
MDYVRDHDRPRVQKTWWLLCQQQRLRMQSKGAEVMKIAWTFIVIMLALMTIRSLYA